MIHMLFDNPNDKKNMEFLKNYSTASFQFIFPQEQCKSIKSMLKICSDCIRNSSKNDTIICWYDFMGILCWWLCKIYHKKRNIVALNILLKDKKTVKNKATKVLYRIALKTDNLKATVTSREYGQSLNRLLGIKKKYILLHDIYHDNYEIEYHGKIQKNKVFCGGRNGRDWEFLLNLTKEMPDIQFSLVVPKDIYAQYKDRFGKNTEVKTEISEIEFLQMMCQSLLVLMPLNTEAPAGLIVMFQAAANGKLIITSDTVTTREYLGSEKGVLCKKEINEWKRQIRYWLEHENEVIERVGKFKIFLEKECSEKKYVEVLEKIVWDFEKK